MFAIFAIGDFKILFSKDKNGEIISDIMMNFFKKSNEKRLQAKNKIGKPSQNTQATVEQEEEFTDSNTLTTFIQSLRTPETLSPIPNSEAPVNQQEPV